MSDLGLGGLLAVGALWFSLLGYLIGLLRFGRKVKAHALQRASHTVVLDGPTTSGKTTLRLRLSYPATDRDRLRQLAATAEAQLHRPLPLCFDPPDRLHVLQFGDISGGNPQGIDEVIRQADGHVIAVWVWNLSKTDDENQRHFNVARLKTQYLTEVGKRVEQVLVFLNKTDELTLDPHRSAQIDDTEALIRDMARSVFGDNYPISFHRGSALEGTGVFDLYGAMLRGLGLEHQFTSLTVPIRTEEAV